MNKFFLLAAFLLVHTAQAQLISLTPVTPGVPWLIGAEHAGDERIFLVRQDGFLVIRQPNGTVLNTPFLDWSSKVKNNGEQGLLGLAFHPDYLNNGYFYIFYSEAGTGNSVLSRLSRSANNPDVADPANEQILLSFPHPSPHHVGGSLKFGTDGYLYLSSGDSGYPDAPSNNGQDPQVFLGKILSLDVDNGMPYAVPADNPFVGQAGYLPEIWCMGLRNPWRLSFDRLTGDCWIGDVGQLLLEEINFIPDTVNGGQNFGWPCMEGSMPFDSCDIPQVYEPPIFEYPHNGNPNCSGSITGGFVYRGHRWAALYGKYIYTDFCTGEVWALSRDGGGVQVVSLGVFNPFDYASIAEAYDGELYIAGYFSNKLYHIESLDCKPVARIEGLPNTIARCAGDNTPIEFEVYGASVSVMNFLWQINGVDQTGETGNNFTVNNFPGNTSVTVLVSNPANGCTNVSNAIVVQVIPPSNTVVDTSLLAGSVLEGVVLESDTSFTRIFFAANGCDSIVLYEVNVITSGLKEASRNVLACQVLPNPARSAATLFFFLENAERDTEVQVFESNGKLLKTFYFPDLGSGKQQLNLPMDDVPNGVLLLRLLTSHAVGKTLLVVQH
ncbi:MAG: PQQ-dependent sugar dehydrogenase [Saprospiraceae bacterium]